LALLLTFAVSFVAKGELSLRAKFDDIHKQVLDDPSTVKDLAQKKMKGSTTELDARSRSLLIATYAAGCAEVGCPDEDPLLSMEVLDEAVKVAEASDDTVLFIRLEIYRLRRRLPKLELHAAETEYTRIQHLAERRGDLRMQAETYREMSALVEKDNDLNKALTRIQMAVKLAEQGAYPDDLIPVVIQHDAALHFRRVGETARAMELYESALRQLKNKKVRHLFVTITVNMARSKMGMSDPKRLDEAAESLQKAQDIMQSIDGAEIKAYISLSLGDIAYKKGQYELALQHFKSALIDYEKLGAVIWVADVLHWKAKTLFKMGHYEETLRALTASREKFPQSFKSDHFRLLELYAAVQEKRRDYAGALSTLKEVIKIKEEIRKEHQEKEINRLRVELQVQVKDLQNELLTKENQQKEAALKQAERIRLAATFLSILSLSVLALLIFSQRQTRKLRHAQGKIQKILDHIDEGIISIDRRSRVETSISSYIYELIQFDPKVSADVLHFLIDKADMHSDDKHLVWSTIQSAIGENQLSWQLNNSHLPHEVSLDGGSRILSLRWRAIVNKSDQVEQIIILVRDETLQKQLEKSLEREKAEKYRKVEKIFEFIGPQSARINEFIQSLESRVKAWEDRIQTDPDWLALARDLHTIKGEARTLGLRGLASQTHALEDEIDMQARLPKRFEGFRQVWQNWHAEVQDYGKLCRQYLHHGEQSATPQARDFIQLVKEVLGGLETYLDQQNLTLNSLVLKDEVIALSPRLIADLRTVVLHAVTNSIDHGFVLPRRQGRFDRTGVELEFSLSKHGDTMILTIADNGAGLNRKALSSLAAKVGQASEQAKPEELVFLEGVSTAQELSETSGRGVGLAAIKAVANQLHGQVTLKDHAGGGTVLTLQWTEAALHRSA
jgi:tetratricopeptide (TPR) repeat protein